MYNIEKLVKKFPLIPRDQWPYLYGINFNIFTGETKLYFFNASFDFLFKYTAADQARQYNFPKARFNLHTLSRIFGHKVNLDAVVIDSYEPSSQAYYLFLENCPIGPYTEILDTLIQRANLSLSVFLEKVNYLNSTSVDTLEACHQNRCICFVKVSPAHPSLKIYSKPFKYNRFDIPAALKQTLLEVLTCRENELIKTLIDCGNAYDFKDGRTSLYTKNNDLKVI